LCPVSGPYPRRFAPNPGQSILPNCVEFSSETDADPTQFAPDAGAGGSPFLDDAVRAAAKRAA